MVNPRGRPAKLKPGERREASSQITVRLNESERALLERVALALRCSNGEALRRGLLELAKLHFSQE